jgi:glutamate dehydrogenase (NADP+)/cyclic pyranopterin phosphate synthase/molybdopterin-guanine dinucleotide biosynthesis protein A
MLKRPPVLAICGFSGSGKTTLIEAVLPQLSARGWRVAVIKHDAHGLQIDQPGKDSDRLFQAGADVVVHGPDQFLLRGHKTGYFDLDTILSTYFSNYDLVLIEGHKDTPWDKVWLDGEARSAVPSGVEHILARLAYDENRVAHLLSLLDQWLPAQWQHMPVYACILIGGKSRRMGQPKHLLKVDGISWVERQTALLKPLVERVVVAGSGDLPETCSGLDRLADVTDAEGPLAGILAAMRWQPDVSWLIAACDMPLISPEAIQWLLAQRHPGRHAIQPRLRADALVEPLLACYEPQALIALQSMVRHAEHSPAQLSHRCPVFSPVVPDELHKCWNNINNNHELEELAVHR